VSSEEIRDIRVSVPEAHEQRAIADFLDSETARIDALIDKKKNLIMLLEQRWRIEVRHRMSALGESHGVIQLRHLVRCLDGKRVPLSAAEREGRQGPIPYYGASGIVDYVDAHLFDEVLVLLGEDGAQLGVPDFSISQVISGKTWVNNHAHVLRPHKVHPEFLTLFLNTFDRMPYISGGLREKITQDDMNRIKVPDVDLETQLAESSRLNEIRTRCEKLAQDLNRQIELLREHRQALITAAVTGQIEIPGVAA
jgi:type I restriction enzyme S subunit